MRFSGKPLAWAAVPLALCLAACGDSDGAPVAAPPPIDVRVAEVGAQSQPERIDAAGTVALRRESPLGFTSAGRITLLSANEGDTVRSGQLLAALDPTTTAATLASAEAERARAAREYARSSELFEKGWVARPRVDSAEAAVRVAEANVRSAQFQLSNSRIVAPGSGIIIARLAEPGQVVAAGTPVLILGDASSGHVLRLAVPDRQAVRLRVGQPAEVSIGALGDERLTGRVLEIAGRADAATGTFLVEVALPADERLRSGQIGTARIIADTAGERNLSVPPQAVFAARAGEAFVYVVDSARNRVTLRRVTLAETTDNSIRLTGGLEPGEMVAVTGIDRLSDGQAVRVVRTGNSAPAAPVAATAR
ncbi:efflux RND transporter periplasmic adaptor subunit [Sphingomonas lacunae]|uniref:Efflux RND transporter periplasmic adaptor subunit n=1 Tax=Sphingomonas lacunae TaxID=2698828 RepID=A0A6M4AS01_9SPHN|nr:efflux RND transporter periplasmic adaptor subunit [Sphingomonas lacunae]QJQ31190.1 efflux RND transporter periplasmic adaptor subunit [Sphingomonas lacunae]